MAQSIGSLVVRLALDAAEYFTGFTKAEAEAQRFAKAVDEALNVAARGVGVALGAIPVAAAAALTAIDQLSKKAAGFKDLEERTGANAEALASFAVSAATASTSMETVANASVRMTKSLTGVNDESKAAGAALTALGLPIKDFKALKPEQQLEAVAKALGGFEDGAGKTAVALALFGREGAAILPFLKQLNEDGGRQVILTQKQIEAADAYADRQARLKEQISLYAQALATEALPAMEALTGAAKEFIFELIGIGKESSKLQSENAVREFAFSAAEALAFVVDAVDGVSRAFRVVGNVMGATGAQLRALASGDFKAYAAIQKEASQTIDDIIAKELFSAKLARQIADQKNRVDTGSPAKRPPLRFDGAETGGNKGARAERQTDAEKYLATLEKQLQATFQLSAVEKLTIDLMSGRLVISGKVSEADLLSAAQRVDAAKAENEAAKELAKTLQDEARAREQAGKMERKIADDAVREREKLAEGNQLLRDEIAIIQGGEPARRAIEQARVSSALALAQEKLNAELAEVGNTALSQALEDQVRILKERLGLLTSKNVAEDAAKTAELIRGYNQQIGDSFASQFEAVISGKKKASDALKDFAKDVEQMISRIAAKNIAEAIFGGGKDGKSGAFDFGSIIQSLFGSTGGGVGGFATGGSPPVGKASMVGEHGRELFVPKVSGTIIPNPMTEKMLRGGSSGPQIGSVIINMPAGTSRQSAEQMALHAGRELSHVLRRRN